MKLLLIAPEGLEVQGFKGSKHAHHLNLALIAALPAAVRPERRRGKPLTLRRRAIKVSC